MITDLLRKSLRLLGLPKAELSVLLVNDRRMRILNHQYRMLDRTTDVLSFPQFSAEELKAEVMKQTSCHFTSDLQTSSRLLPLGDIVINVHMAKRQAEENGLTLNEEIKRLLIHGLLHLIGCDHEMGAHAERRMKRLSSTLLRELAEA